MEFLLNLPGLLIAIVFHELAHGVSAYWLGDPTAKKAGRLTLNPISHMDPLGFLSMLIFRFGWAKPVPINPYYFKNRKLGMLIVSLAGIFMNLVLALITAFVIVYIPIKSEIIYQMALATLWYNVMLAMFNLLPFPPLDGSKVVASLLPTKAENFLYQYERYFSLILIVLIFTRVIQKILGPLVQFAGNAIINFVFMLG